MLARTHSVAGAFRRAVCVSVRTLDIHALVLAAHLETHGHTL